MNNFIVLHYLNGKTISRFDFGEELDKAIDFIHYLMEQVHQIGKHHLTVMCEITHKTYYNQRFEIIED